MDGWTDRQMDGALLGQQTDGQIGTLMDEWIVRQMSRQSTPKLLFF